MRGAHTFCTTVSHYRKVYTINLRILNARDYYLGDGGVAWFIPMYLFVCVCIFANYHAGYNLCTFVLVFVSNYNIFFQFDAFSD